MYAVGARPGQSKHQPHGPRDHQNVRMEEEYQHHQQQPDEPDSGMNAISACAISISTCLLHSITYVASLYIWNYQHGRNHPNSIIKRFISVFIMMFVSPIFLYVALDKQILEKKTFLEVLGLRVDGLLQALIMPLFLSMILYLGPLYMQMLNGLLKIYTEPMHWINNLKDLTWIRAHIMAPLSEEFSFRSCMLPLLLQCFPPLAAVLVCPIFFGAAHFHHYLENVKQGMEKKDAVLMSLFHCTYTTVFGAYSAYLFYRTGHLSATIITHAFFNHMGIPDVAELMQYQPKQRAVVSLVFVIGFVAWCYLLNPLTEPRWYKNEIYYK